MTDYSFLSVQKQSYVSKTMDALVNETSLLREWFKAEYPECSLVIHMDLNKITLELKLTLRVTTSKDVTDNQGFFENKLIIPEKQFFNNRVMSEFLRRFNEEFRKNISLSVNNHILNERLKNGE